jgi:outer membrane protein OmpA-like peptidoglycan-associated protein
VQAFVANRLFHFASGKAVVRREDRQFLSEVAKRIDACKPLRVAVVGHTDSDGSRRYNLKLSRQRAEAVARPLTKNAVAAQHFSISGEGESSPAKPNTTRANKAYNRRVTMQVF